MFFISQDLYYTETNCNNLGATEITQEAYLEFEHRKDDDDTDDGMQYQLNDLIFVKAIAWKASVYSHIPWPYDSRIESSFFEASVAKIFGNGSKVSLKFAAFDLDERKKQYTTSWLRRYAVQLLPEGSFIISKELYESREAVMEDVKDNEVDTDCAAAPKGDLLTD